MHFQACWDKINNCWKIIFLDWSESSATYWISKITTKSKIAPWIYVMQQQRYIAKYSKKNGNRSQTLQPWFLNHLTPFIAIWPQLFSRKAWRNFARKAHRQFARKAQRNIVRNVHRNFTSIKHTGILLGKLTDSLQGKHTGIL